MSHRNQTTFTKDAPGRAATIGRLGAAVKWSRSADPEARRAATAKARQAHQDNLAAKRAEDAAFAALSLEGKANRIKAEADERIARLQLASVEAARKRRMDLAAREPIPVIDDEPLYLPGSPEQKVELDKLDALIDMGVLVKSDELTALVQDEIRKVLAQSFALAKAGLT